MHSKTPQLIFVDRYDSVTAWPRLTENGYHYQLEVLRNVFRDWFEAGMPLHEVELIDLDGFLVEDDVDWRYYSASLVVGFRYNGVMHKVAV